MHHFSLLVGIRTTQLYAIGPIQLTVNGDSPLVQILWKHVDLRSVLTAVVKFCVAMGDNHEKLGGGGFVRVCFCIYPHY